jgi:hypothetical protein
VGRLIERALEEGQFWWPSWGLVEPAATLGRVCAWNTCARGVFLAFWSCHSFQEDALDRGLGVLFPPARHCFGTKKSKMRGVLQRAPEPIEAPLFCCLCCLLTHRPFLALLLTPYQVGQANLPTPPACGGSGCCCWLLAPFLLLAVAAAGPSFSQHAFHTQSFQIVALHLSCLYRFCCERGEVAFGPIVCRSKRYHNSLFDAKPQSHPF